MVSCPISLVKSSAYPSINRLIRHELTGKPFGNPPSPCYSSGRNCCVTYCADHHRLEHSWDHSLGVTVKRARTLLINTYLGTMLYALSRSSTDLCSSSRPLFRCLSTTISVPTMRLIPSCFSLFLCSLITVCLIADAIAFRLYDNSDIGP